MTNYKKITGNYLEVLQQTGLFNTFGEHSSDALETIQADLPRTPVFHYQENQDRFQNLWNSLNSQQIYSQGDMTANIFSLIFQSFAQQQSLEIGDDNSLFMPKNKGQLNFAYFDDAGVPCGFSVIYSKRDPQLWSAAIIHNTTNTPENRTVTIICHEDIVDNQDERLIFEDQALTNLMSTLHSSALQLALSSMLFSNGQINDAAILKLNQQINTVHRNKVEALQTILSNRLTSAQTVDQSKTQILRLLLLLNEGENNSAYFNQLTLADIQEIQDDPSQSHWLNEFTNIDPTADVLDVLISAMETYQTGKIDAINIENDLLSRYETYQKSKIELENNLNSSLFKKNVVYSLFTLSLLITIAACFFFPPAIAIALTALAIPIIYEWHRTSKSIDQDEMQLRHLATTNPEQELSQIAEHLQRLENNLWDHLSRISDLIKKPSQNLASVIVSPSLTSDFELRSHEQVTDDETMTETQNSMQPSSEKNEPQATNIAMDQTDNTASNNPKV